MYIPIVMIVGALLGWGAALALSTPVLMVLIVLAAFASHFVYKDMKGRGLDAVPYLITLIFLVVFIVSTLIFWYVVTDSNFIGYFFRSYILR